MLLSLVLLLLLGSDCKALHFMGTVMTYYPKDTYANQSVKVVLRSKTGFHDNGGYINTWTCLSGNCGSEVPLKITVIDSESSLDWSQQEEIWTRLVPSNAPFQLQLSGSSWANNNNGISSWQAVTLVDMRNRSDTNKADSPPLTTILPRMRVPSNCQRDFNLLAFDPDRDDVRCRYGSISLSECNPCTLPPVLNLSSSCTLSFKDSNSNTGAYAVQLVMEDFPKQNIILTQSDGSQVVKTNNDAISKIPVQFVVNVDPVVPSCVEGLYLPRFLSPTPANGAQLYTLVNQYIEISIKAEALNSTISELLYSGPSTISLTTVTPGQYILRWTPSQDEDGESHPICFVVQANSNSTDKYHSELRCVVVTVGNKSSTPSPPPATTPLPSTSPITSSNYSSRVVLDIRLRISSSSSVSIDIIKTTIIQQIKDELVRRGIPSSATLSILRSVATTANPGG